MIKESIEDDSVIDYMSINKIELWNTGGNQKYIVFRDKVLKYTIGNIEEKGAFVIT